MRVVKKRFFYGQADHKGGPPGPLPQPYDQLFVIFLGVCLTLDYDYMCSETDFRQDNKRIGLLVAKLAYYNCSSLLAAALSQNGLIA